MPDEPDYSLYTWSELKDLLKSSHGQIRYLTNQLKRCGMLALAVIKRKRLSRIQSDALWMVVEIVSGMPDFLVKLLVDVPPEDFKPKPRMLPPPPGPKGLH
jgi:hypothetical protein